MTETYKRYRIKVAVPIAALMLLIALVGWVTLDKSGEQYAYARFMVIGGALTLGVFTAADAKRDNRDVCVDKALSLWYNEYIAVRRRSPCRRRAKLCPDPRTLRGGLPI